MPFIINEVVYAKKKRKPEDEDYRWDKKLPTKSHDIYFLSE